MVDKFEYDLDVEMLEFLIAETVENTLDQYELKRLPENGMLAACLEAYTKKRLLKLANDNGVDVKQGWLKARIVEQLSDDIMERIIERFLLLGESNLEILQQFSSGAFESVEGTMEEAVFNLSVYPVAVRMGLLYSLDDGDGVVITMPVEVKDALDVVLANVDQIKEDYRSQIKVWEQIDEALRASVHLYGVTTASDVMDLWEIRYPDPERTFEETMDFMKYLFSIVSLIALKNDYCSSKYLIGSREFIDEEDIEGFYSSLLDKMDADYYEPTKEEVEYYSEHAFDRRSDVYRRLKQFIAKRTENVEMVMDLLEQNITAGYELSALMEEIAAYGLLQFESEKHLEEFVGLYVELHNHSRLWENGGYTPTEMVERYGGLSENE